MFEELFCFNICAASCRFFSISVLVASVTSCIFTHALFHSLHQVSPLFEALSKAALMNPDPPEAGENEGDDELIFDQTAFAAAGGASEEQVGRKRLGMDGCLSVTVFEAL
jgi:hypothetical protein